MCRERGGSGGGVGKKVENGRGGGHRIGNKGEIWWDYAGL